MVLSFSLQNHIHMLYIAIALTLLALMAGVLMLWKVKTDAMGGFAKWMSYLVIVTCLGMFICEIGQCCVRMAHCRHDMEGGYGMCGGGGCYMGGGCCMMGGHGHGMMKKDEKCCEEEMEGCEMDHGDDHEGAGHHEHMEADSTKQ